MTRNARESGIENRKQPRRLILMAVAALGGVLTACSGEEPDTREIDATSVITDQVKRGPLERSVRGPGTLAPADIHRVIAGTEGQIKTFVVEPGARVEPDTTILVLSNPALEQSAADAELALRAAEAEFKDLDIRLTSALLDQQTKLAQVRAEWESAKLQAEADIELSKDGLVPDIQRRQSELAAEQMSVRYDKERERLAKISQSNSVQLANQRQKVERSRAAEASHRKKVESLEVRAGAAGILHEVSVQPGQPVTPGTDLAEVANPRWFVAELRIAETEAKEIAIGQTAAIDTGSGIIPGRVSRIDPMARDGSVQIDVRLTDDALSKSPAAGLSVNGTIEIERIDGALYLKLPAHAQTSGTIRLFKIGADNTATPVTVMLGRLSGQTVEILSGLDEGDRVILSDTSAWDGQK